jgi:tRNA pseudouridine55 synthase
MDGLILVHKPKGVTSHDVVISIRKNLRVEKVGHFGTLDPMATGLLLIALGKATRLFLFYLQFTKTYMGQIRLGFSTDTYDSEGNPSSAESSEFPDKKSLLINMQRFVGEIEQVPPPYSAKKYKGESLYKRVRKRKDFELRPAKVTVHSFRLKKYSPPLLDFDVTCSSGTYIRSMAHDLGNDLGCRAHLNRLTRTEIGEFHIGKSHTIEEIGQLASLGQSEKFLLPMEILLPDFPKLVVDDSIASRVRSGNSFNPASSLLSTSPKEGKKTMEKRIRDIYRIFDSRGKLIAFAKKEKAKNSFQPFMVFDSKN